MASAPCNGVVEPRIDGGRCPKCYLTNQTPGTVCGTALRRQVVLDAQAQGRFVKIDTYREGAGPKDIINERLLFHSQADAERCRDRLLGRDIEALERKLNALRDAVDVAIERMVKHSAEKDLFFTLEELQKARNA